jgi:hypothetical protein
MLWACAALALIGGAASMGASANTINMADYNGSGDTVSCNGLDSGACLGFVGAFSVGPPTSGLISLDDANADDYPQNGSSNATEELARLNELLALFNPARNPPLVTHVNKTDGDGSGFSTSLQYFSIKKANELWYFENTSGGAVTVNLLGDADDYSHWTEYGTPSAVPIPAAAWLFGTALIGFVGMSRRRKVG